MANTVLRVSVLQDESFFGASATKLGLSHPLAGRCFLSATSPLASYAVALRSLYLTRTFHGYDLYLLFNDSSWVMTEREEELSREMTQLWEEFIAGTAPVPLKLGMTLSSAPKSTPPAAPVEVDISADGSSNEDSGRMYGTCGQRVGGSVVCGGLRQREAPTSYTYHGRCTS